MSDDSSVEVDRRWREGAARIQARAAELMVEHDDWSVRICFLMAMHEEAFLYGVPSAGAPPVGILGCSPLGGPS